MDADSYSTKHTNKFNNTFDQHLTTRDSMNRIFLRNQLITIKESIANR